MIRVLALAGLALLLGGCPDRFTPDSYAIRAVQQANRAEQGVVVGVRSVRIAADGEIGAATGAAAGGVLGAQAPGSGIVSALGGVGGALVGGLFGKAAESAAVDADAFEYIIRTAAKGELVSVTQRDRAPLTVGQPVLVIAGAQARVVPDYTVPGMAPPNGTAAPSEPRPEAAALPATAPTDPTVDSVLRAIPVVPPLRLPAPDR